MVPGGLLVILVTANRRESEEQISVLPRLASPPAGTVPRKTVYFFIPIQPSLPVTLTVIVLLPILNSCPIIASAGQSVKLALSENYRQSFLKFAR